MKRFIAADMSRAMLAPVPPPRDCPMATTRAVRPAINTNTLTLFIDFPFAFGS